MAGRRPSKAKAGGTEEGCRRSVGRGEGLAGEPYPGRVHRGHAGLHKRKAGGDGKVKRA